LIKSSHSALEVEELLRGSAPALPLALKKRTLNQCAARTAQRQQRLDRLHWQMTWVVAGVLALQALTLFVVDSQNMRLFSGDSAPSPYTPITMAQVAAVCRQREQQLALLSAQSRLG
jgi:hypothetical protein